MIIFASRIHNNSKEMKGSNNIKLNCNGSPRWLQNLSTQFNSKTYMNHPSRLLLNTNHINLEHTEKPICCTIYMWPCTMKPLEESVYCQWS